jgi:uncharacterized protein involved in exopolysaccharide biosynthesis
LTANATALPAGPQIVTLTFVTGDPTVAAGTVRAMIDQFSEELNGRRHAQLDAAIAFYQQRLKAQEAALASADAKVSQYLVDHPDQRLANAIPDVTLVGLKRSDDLARQDYENMLQKLDQARLDLAALTQPGAGAFRVIDEPNVPLRPLSLMKKFIFAAGAGTAAGLAVSLLGLLLLTLADTSLRRPQEIEELLGLRLVGTIPKLGAKRA